MARSKTEAEKVAASERQKMHWRRCETWGQVLQIDKMMVNDHWSCCIKPARDPGNDEGPPPVGVVIAVKQCFAECLLKKAKREQEFLERRTREQIHARSPKPSKTPDTGEVPALEARIKIMFWVIRTCGGVENARDALDRAARSLEDE